MVSFLHCGKGILALRVKCVIEGVINFEDFEFFQMTWHILLRVGKK